MPPEFENMTAYIKMWLAVLINDIFHNLSDLVNIRTTWQARSASLQPKVELGDVVDAGVDGFLAG